jgi:hypothetical protein
MQPKRVRVAEGDSGCGAAALIAKNRDLPSFRKAYSGSAPALSGKLLGVESRQVLLCDRLGGG